MAGNVIYRGPVNSEAESVSDKKVAGAYLPGILVTESATEFTMATAADIEGDLLILSNRNFFEQSVATAYADEDTGVAFRPRVGEIYQVRLANATYAKGANLTIGADGRLIASGVSERVFATFDDVPGAYSAGTLADVRIANNFVTAAS
jgi:hypothetical protein